MITPSHIIYSWAVAKATESGPNKSHTLAFLAGGVLPDLPVYTFFMVHTFILGSSQQLMWDVLYFDSAWTPFITLSHSLLLWPLVLVIGTIFKQNIVRWIGLSALLHISLDFLVHHDDAYRHFWPLTDWKFMSPISYWDPQYYGNWVGAIDTIVILGLLTWLGTIYKTTKARTGIAAVMIFYIIATILPYLIW